MTTIAALILVIAGACFCLPETKCLYCNDPCTEQHAIHSRYGGHLGYLCEACYRGHVEAMEQPQGVH